MMLLNCGVGEDSCKSPLDCKEIKPVNPKVNHPWIFIGRTDAEVPILWPPDVKSWLIGKDPDVRRASLVPQMIKNPPTMGSIPGVGRSCAEGHSCPLQYSGLENSTVNGLGKRHTQLSDFHFHWCWERVTAKHKQGSRGWEFRWHCGLTDSMDMSLSKLQEPVKDWEAWHAALHGVAKSRAWLRYWTTTNWYYETHNIQVSG